MCGLRSLALPIALALAFAPLVATASAVAASVFVTAPPSERTARAQLLLRDGNWIDATITSIGPESFSIVSGDDLSSAPRIVPRASVIACLPGSAPPRSMLFLTQLTSGTLVLNDGQLIPGSFRPEGESPRWEHRWLGTFPIKTDSISEIRLNAVRRAPARADSDTILFANGDVVTGFIESLGQEAVFEPLADSDDAASKTSPQPAAQPTEKTNDSDAKQASATRRVPLDRIAAIAFAALERPAPRDALVWTDDGTIVRAATIAFTGTDGWSFSLADPLLGGGGSAKPIGDGVMRPVAILFDPAAVTPLVACATPERSATPSSYRYEAAPEARVDEPDRSLLGLGSIELDGPVRAKFAIPDGVASNGETAVFSAEFSLMEPVPPDARLSLSVRFGEAAAVQRTLDAATRRTVVTVEGRLASARALEIAIDDGGNGIAGDRVVIRRACIIRAR